MAVYSTMIRDDPDSRARMRVTPEQALNLPVHFCLASWIAAGTRTASFIGQTFPFPQRIPDAWARIHLERLAEKVGPYPETMASTLERVPTADAPSPSEKRKPGSAPQRARPAPRATPRTRPANAKRERPTRRARCRDDRADGNAADGTATRRAVRVARRTAPRVRPRRHRELNL